MPHRLTGMILRQSAKLRANSVGTDQFLDPIWRLHNLYKVVDKKRQAHPIQARTAVQLEFLTNIHSRDVILKSRQRGFTTLICLMYLDDCIFTPNVNAAVIAHKMDDAKVIFRNKVRMPYDNLDPVLKLARPASQDSADTMTWANKSSFRVSTSVRSSTVNWLLISEYGKICSQFPDKAEEIKSGAFPAAEQGVIIIESTAEGEGGDFYDKSQTSQQMLNQGVDLTRKDYKFFFFPWWRAPEYQMERTNIPIGPDDEAYFERIGHEIKAIPFLAEHFKGFSKEQMNWYVTEEREQGGNMKREYPSTPQEAFAQALEGAIFADDIAAAYKHDRIGHYPLDSRYPVNTFWDLGRSHGNATAIWLEQDIQGQPRMVGYLEFEGEMIDQILRKLKEWALDNNASRGASTTCRTMATGSCCGCLKARWASWAGWGSIQPL
jgi:hypothetical protein